VERRLSPRLGAAVQTGSPTGGSRAGSPFFKIYPNQIKLVKSKWMPYLALKIHNFLHEPSLEYSKQRSKL
jgi:hypothetical protein